MLEQIKRFFKPIYPSRKKRLEAKRIYQEWIEQGKPVPPPHVVKQKTIREYARRYKTGTLVETGTYLGDMVAAQLTIFSSIISIELSTELFEKAKLRFHKRSHVKLCQGDSSKVLLQIMPGLNKPALFWLDGHYSGGITAKGDKYCPVYEELDAIFSNDIGHVILIDDAREFTGQYDYPTIKELETYIKSKNPAYTITVEDDIIRVVIS